ncbi:MAG: fasciclin domain-containing protein [Bacteroidia bacterium]|nr:fasciclin domain-containing protein [Bacteroidia bacterium]
MFTSCGGGDTANEETGDTLNSEETTGDMETEEETMTEEAAGQDIVALAQETESLSTLVQALQAADLVSALQGEGPFTVFAPTNEAFSALGEQLTELLKPENKEKLADILKYHVVSGKVMSGDLSDGQKAATLQGAEITISTTDGVKLNNKATVTTADVEASNGVVHIIDAVILPPAQ